jgi:hypothetical protein
MTVTELLSRIQAAYPGASSDALRSFVPVFHARLRQHEGDRLEEAATAVLSEFMPKATQPFPIPANFEKHLPSGKLVLPSTETPMRDLFAKHRQVHQQLMADWNARQGQKIAQGRGKTIARACEWEAARIADMAAWKTNPGPIVLSAEKIQICEDRAVSQARMHRYGAIPLRRGHEIQWESQTEAVRAALRENTDPEVLPMITNTKQEAA